MSVAWNAALERWSTPARVLHWSVAGMLPFQLYLGWAADAAPDRAEGARLIGAHFQLGVIVFTLMVLRLSWRLARGKPVAIAGNPAWQAKAARIVHTLLYVPLLMLPLSGYVMWIWMGARRSVFGLIELPALFIAPTEDERGRALAWYVHHYCALLLVALITLHIFAAIYHEVKVRDGLLRRRML